MTATDRVAAGWTARDRSSDLVTGRTLMDTGSGHAEGGWSLARDLDLLQTSQPARFPAGALRHVPPSAPRLPWVRAPWRSAWRHRLLADLMGS